MSERIQKVLATAGVASRRAVEQMIAEGRIMVNGRPATVGQKIDYEDKVRVDGRPIKLARKEDKVRVLLYKKRVGEIVTRDDPDGRRTIFRKLPELANGRWIAIGRLDINTSGLLLLTNNGELARRLTHPSFEVPREYAARVLGEVTEETLANLRKGVKLEDGTAKFESIEPGENEDGEGERRRSGDAVNRVASRRERPAMDGRAGGRSEDKGRAMDGKANHWYRVVVREGRNRLVRRLLESQDLQVSRLIRTAYGPIKLGGGIKSGSARDATPEELKALLAAVEL